MIELTVEGQKDGPAQFEAKESGGNSGTAAFGAKERSSNGGAALFEAKERGSAGFSGVERRRRHRRVKADRREEMRFEPDKADRRANPGRRADDKSPKFW